MEGSSSLFKLVASQAWQPGGGVRWVVEGLKLERGLTVMQTQFINEGMCHRVELEQPLFLWVGSLSLSLSLFPSLPPSLSAPPSAEKKKKETIGRRQRRSYGIGSEAQGLRVRRGSVSPRADTVLCVHCPCPAAAI